MEFKNIICCGLGLLGTGVGFAAQTPTMGCAWYPEAWPKERRATDLELMQKAGIDSVRIGEFNWANFEPREGVFDFADFKTVLDELAKRGMTALLCTATAAPPRWFFAKYPEAWKFTDAGGKHIPIEHRRQYCVNNPDFRRRARALTEAQVAAFAGHPAIRAWQIDNELSSDAEGGHCTCRHCAAAFRTWLKRKYGTLENLNRAWNGAFWSNAVQDWEQIRPPFVTMIPVFRFDYTRFQSDSFQAFAEEQAAIIRAKDTRPICYNSWMSWQGDFDLAKFTKKMGFVACDTYLGPDFMQIYRAAWDLYRGLKRQPFTVAETGPFNSITARDNATDFLRPAYWEMFAHGADAVYWFRWRRSVMGEEACRAIVQHDGRPGRPYDVISNVRRELLDVLKRTGDLPLPENRIAVLFSSWDVQLGRSEDGNVPPYGATTRHYAAIRSTGLGVDVVPIAPEADLSKYALVVIPRCEYLPDDFVKKLREYVKKGGVLHAGARLNVREDSCVYRTASAPYGLTDMFGLSVREYCNVCARNGESFATYKPARDLPDGTFKGTVAGGTATFDREMEDVTLEGARAVEKFPGGLYKGAPLYAEHAFGKGRAFYQAACVDFETEKRLLKHAFGAAGLKPVADLPDDVSRVRRGDVVIYTNVREEPQTFRTTDTGTALVGPAPANGELTLPAYGASVLRVFAKDDPTAEPGPASAALPTGGICAHRGDRASYPENTVPAFLAAVSNGAAMVEFDVHRCKTGELIVMHDETIDRTTTGHGRWRDLSFDYLRSVDAGVKFGTAFAGTKIPTFDEAIDCFPKDGVWLNVHCGDDVTDEVARKIRAKGRLHQAFIAAREEGVARARAAVPEIKVCLFAAPSNSWGHVWTPAERRAAIAEVMAAKAEFTQPHFAAFEPEELAAYHAAGGKVNFFWCNKPGKLGQLLARGIDFPLTDNLKPMVEAYRRLRGVPCVPPDPERGFRYLPDSSKVTGRLAPIGAGYRRADRQFGGIPSVAVSPKNGRLWRTYYAGPSDAEDSNNYVVLSTRTGTNDWQDVLCFDPDGDGPLRSFDPEVWIAPDGKLYWFWTERKVAVRDGLLNRWGAYQWEANSEHLRGVALDAENPPTVPYPAPRTLVKAGGVMMCKPIVARDGSWLYPVAFWNDDFSARIYRSTDGGKTLLPVGGATLPERHRDFDEHNIVELKDGTLRVYMRAGCNGAWNAWQADSHDGGRTWDAAKPCPFPHPGSRLFVRRLASGALLLVKNGSLVPPKSNFGRRRDMMAFVSDDDGATWKGGLLLHKGQCAYPDGDQAPDGTIHVTFDGDRNKKQEIFHVSFTEDDVRRSATAPSAIRATMRSTCRPDAATTTSLTAR